MAITLRRRDRRRLRKMEAPRPNGSRGMASTACRPVLLVEIEATAVVD